MSGNKKSNWLKSHSNDFYVRLSKKNDYKSRAAYKLIELEEKFNLIKDSRNVLDLGCAPGSWLQVLSSFPNLKSIVGVDRLEIDRIQGAEFFRYDISDLSLIDILTEKFNCKFNLVLSDIAPNITGIADIDQANFTSVTENVLQISNKLLEKEGNLIIKQFNGPRLREISNILEISFRKIEVFKPKSSKKNSSEIYIVCKGFKDC